MNKLSKTIVSAILTVCLLCGSFAGVFGGASVSVKADDFSRNSDTYFDYYFGNIVPLRDYLIKLGFDFDDEDDQEFLSENFLDYYNQAAEDGIIKPCDNDILLAGSLDQGGSRWNSDGRSTSAYNTGTHQMLAKFAYDYASALYPGLYTPGNDSPFVGDRSILVPHADYPDISENGNLNNYHFYTDGSNYFYNVLNSGMNAKTQFIAHYNDAVDFYFGQNGKVQSKTESFKALGKALHYMGDMTSPVHTGDRLSMPEALLGELVIAGVILMIPVMILAAGSLAGDILTRVVNHTSFEDVAQEYATLSIFPSFNLNSITPSLASYSLDSLAETVAASSKSYYSQVGGPLNFFVSRGDRESVTAKTIPDAIDACASVLIKFAHEVGFHDVSVSGSLAYTTGAGPYAKGSTVSIYAGSKQGYTFNGWTVNNGLSSFPNAGNATATFTMPNNNVSVTANWKMSVSVSGSYANPSGAGSYTTGSTVTINAGSRVGHVFNGWTVFSGNVIVNNPSNPTATFTMKNDPVIVVAHWTETTPVIDMYSGDYYAEKILNVSAGQYKNAYVSSASGGTYVIQTFGTKDAFLALYSLGGTLLASNDNSGYGYNALISYNLAANTYYELRVSFVSPSESGAVKLAVMTSASSYASYSNVDKYDDYSNGMTIYGIPSSGYVDLLRLEYSTTSTVTYYYTDYGSDYLCIIDPRSTDPLIGDQYNSGPWDYPNLYCHCFWGCSNAELTKQMDANVEYLLIFSYSSGYYLITAY